MDFSFAYLEKKKPKGKFVLSRIAKIVGYSSLKKYKIGKSAKAIEGQEKKSKGKSAKVEKKVCSSN
jgi:hypothetical protein